LIAGDECRSATGRLDVTPKKTEQNLIVRIGKSEAKVTNDKRLRSSLKKNRAASATAELLVLANASDKKLVNRPKMSLC